MNITVNLLSVNTVILGKIFGESYGCGIVGGRVGGWGIGNEGGADLR